MTAVQMMRILKAERKSKVSFLEKISNLLIILAVIAIFNIGMINLVFFPDCNRINRGCFLVQNLWGQK